jgi:hypothetical protein
MFWLLHDTEAMIFTTKSGQSFDTEKDLTAPERHVLQKLFLWKSMASSVEEFRRKKQEALVRGWNDSGPIPESRSLRCIVEDLEHKVLDRLKEENKGPALRHKPPLG